MEILEAIAAADLVSPGDIVVKTGLPRYLILAAFQCLEALGLIEQVYVRGSYKVYTITMHGRKVLEALRAGEPPLSALFNTLPAPTTPNSEESIAANS